MVLLKVKHHNVGLFYKFPNKALSLAAYSRLLVQLCGRIIVAKSSACPGIINLPLK